MDFGQVALKAGQTYTVEIEMDFGDEEVARDFSVVANGMSGGAVTVARSDGVATAKLPVIWRNGKAPPNPPPATTTPATPAATGTTTGGTTPAVSDGTFANKKNKALNAKVKAYKQSANMGPCGSGYKTVTNGTDTVELIFKNTCQEYSLISTYTLTLD